MFIFGNLFTALATVVNIILSIVYWLILVRALISWVNPDPYNAIVRFLYKATEPILQPIRRLLPPMGIDISPIIAFILIVFLKSFVVASLYSLGNNLQ